MSLTILCLSRAAFTTLMPALDAQGKEIKCLHITQTEGERKRIEAQGGDVVLVLETLIKHALKDSNTPIWAEPEDFRETLNFNWSPVYCDRHLPNHGQKMQDKVAGIIFKAFSELFNKYKIAGVLSEPVAIFPIHVLQYLCKKHNAKSLFWVNTYFPGYFYFASKVPIDFAIRENALVGQDVEEMRTSITDYVNGVVTDSQGPIYHHKFTKTRPSVFKFFRQRSGHEAYIVLPGIMSIGLQAMRLMRVIVARLLFPYKFDYMSSGSVAEHKFFMKNLFMRRGIYNEPPTEYVEGNIFFPLQYEPEASLLYSAPEFRNQFAVIESICQCLPHGKTLWIKEHPNQFGVLSQRQWRKLRKKYSNLKFIFGHENGRELIKACGLAIAITSTAALDAMLFGRRTIILGDTFFKQFKGSIAIRSIDDLAKRVNDMSNYGIFDHKDEIIEQMVEFGKNSYPGDPQPSPDLYSDANLQHLYNAVVNEVKATDRW